MVCPKCKAPLPPGAILCGKCGTRFQTKVCPHCKSAILAIAVTCPHCGKKVPQTVQPAPVYVAPPGTKAKKPLQKRWWFWTICAVLVIGIIGNMGNAVGGGNDTKSRAIPSSSVAATPTPEPATPEPTEAPTASPTPEPTPVQAAEEEPTSTPEPTVAPTASPTPEPTPVQAAEEKPASTPEPTKAPETTTKPSENTSHAGGAGANNFDTYDNPNQQQTEANYVLNTSSRKIHHPTCKSVKKIAPNNYQEFYGTLDEALGKGYSKCGICFK